MAGDADRVRGTETTQLLTAVAMNAVEATRTSAAHPCTEMEYVRVAYDLTLGGTGIAADDTFSILVLGSFDGGSTYRLLDNVKADLSAVDAAPARTISAGDISAGSISRDIGSFDIAGLDSIKVRAATSGTADGSDLVDVYVKVWRE